MSASRRFALLLAVMLLLGLEAPAAQAAWPHDPNNGNVPLCTAANDQNLPTIVSDGAGGAIVTWYDSRSVSGSDIYAQRVNAAGVPQWTLNGVVLCAAANDQQYPQIVSDGAGGAIVTWQDFRSGTTYDIYAQRVNAAGVPQWSIDGVSLCTASFNQTTPTLVSDGSGGAIVTWEDFRSGTNNDIYAQRVNAAGAPQWTANGVALCSAASNQFAPTIVSDSAGGAIVTWYDSRSFTNNDIYAQRVNAAGVPQWTANGVALCTAALDQYNPTIVSDGAGGAIVTWNDYRSSTTHIYAQRVNAAGVPQWTADGVALCTAANFQSNPKIATDGSGGAIVTWQDQRSGSGDIFAQRVNAAGVPQWSADGVALCAAAYDQLRPMIASDGAGGAIVTWDDGRSGTADIYAQRVNAAGVPQWTADGVALCTAAHDQLSPTIASDGAGGAIVTWNDYRSGTNYDIYAQRIDSFGYLGNPEPASAGVRDVPNDQGSKVKVSWSASYLDGAPYSLIDSYWILRSAPPNVVAQARAMGALATADLSAEPEPGVRTFFALPDHTTGYSWEFIASQPSFHVSNYSYVATTTSDSVGTSNPRTAFMIMARTAGGAQYWFSAPDSGYSVDNLPPVAPAPFSASYVPPNGTFLNWGANAESDLAGYRLYRGPSLGFTPSPANRIYDGRQNSYHDPTNSTFIFKVCAYDIHGNEGQCSTVQPTGTADAGSNVPHEVTLAPISPNPAHETATLRLGLPRDGIVRLAIYDAQGRRVRSLMSGWRPAGQTEVRWDGRNETGARATSGLYFARLEAGGLTLARRLAMME